MTTLRFIARTPIYAALIAILGIALLRRSRCRSAQEQPRAAIVFWPGPQPLAKPPALERLAQAPGLEAFGFMSTIQGSYTPEQTFLDMSAGARTTTSLYDGDVPTDLRLLPDGRIVARGTRSCARARQRRPPTSCPGLLAGTLRAAGVARRLCRAARVAQP